MSEKIFIRKYTADRSTNPWAGMTSTALEEETNKFLKSAQLNENEYVFFEHLNKYKINNKHLIGKHKSKKIINIESAFFSDLKKANGTDSSKDKPQIIGKIDKQIFSHISFQDIAGFLIESQIITTYWHIESEIFLIKENINELFYTGYFTGEHIYFTNSKNVDKFDFVLEINKKTGEILIK